jgi:hypothetical protein
MRLVSPSLPKLELWGREMFGLPTTWLVGGAVIAVGLFFGAVQLRHNAKLAAAHNTGVAVGKAEVATTTLAEAKKAGDDWREAEAETPLDADREYFKTLCAKSASCALREKYRGQR